jgi:hypothetical protein
MKRVVVVKPSKKSDLSIMSGIIDPIVTVKSESERKLPTNAVIPI